MLHVFRNLVMKLKLKLFKNEIISMENDHGTLFEHHATITEFKRKERVSLSATSVSQIFGWPKLSRIKNIGGKSVLESTILEEVEHSENTVE